LLFCTLGTKVKTLVGAELLGPLAATDVPVSSIGVANTPAATIATDARFAYFMESPGGLVGFQDQGRSIWLNAQLAQGC
jgi:hypothetical protein